MAEVRTAGSHPRAGRRNLFRARQRQRSGDRDLEQRLHGIRARRRRHAQPAAGPVNRHRHGPGAHHRVNAGSGLELRHRSVYAAARGSRPARRAPLRWIRRRPRRYLDAGGRRPRPRDDFSHRRRRDAVERMARLRAAQDHAPRDATRPAPRPHRTVSPYARRRARPSDGGRLSRGPRQPDDGREDHSGGGEPVRRGSEGRASPPRGRDREGARCSRTQASRRRGLPPLRHVRHSLRFH